MAENDTPLTAAGLSEILTAITDNRELMEKISQIAGPPSTAPSTDTSSTAGGIDAVLSDPALMAKLPAVIEALRPMFSDPHPQASKKEEQATTDNKTGGYGAASKRTALLCALKPYLSPKRCEAIDYIDRMSKMGDLIKNIKH